MEEISTEKNENENLYKFVGYSVITVIIIGIIAMFGFLFHYQINKVGVVYCEFPYIGDIKFDDAFTMNGDKVGMIKGIYANEPNRVILTINLKKPIEIHDGYKLFIGDVGIMGERVVNMENGSQDAPLIDMTDTLAGQYYPGISDMLGKIGQLRAFLDSAMLFVDNIQHGTDSARSIIQWLDKTEKSIDKIARNTANTIKNIDDDLPEILRNINNFSDEFNANMLKFGYKLPDILEKTDNIIIDCDTLLLKLAKVQDFGDDIEQLVEKIDTLNINTINTTITDLQKQIQTIREEALKLKLRWVKDRSDENR